jgi:hypothetical protein
MFQGRVGAILELPVIVYLIWLCFLFLLTPVYV